MSVKQRWIMECDGCGWELIDFSSKSEAEEKARKLEWKQEEFKWYCMQSSCRNEVKVSNNSCNRHTDCASVKEKAIKEGKNPYIICCHDDCCEDCFGC